MDLRQYYKKLHELEAKMLEEHVLVVSVDTGDGGKEGVITEVGRRNACQLILEGRARRAKPEEEEDFRSQESKRRGEFVREKAASRVQVHLMSSETGVLVPGRDGQ